MLRLRELLGGPGEGKLTWAIGTLCFFFFGWDMRPTKTWALHQLSVDVGAIYLQLGAILVEVEGFLGNFM